jgi:hypothetical protein
MGLESTTADVLDIAYVIECKRSKHEWVVFLPSAGAPREVQWDAKPCFHHNGIGSHLVDVLDGLTSEPCPEAVESADAAMCELPLIPEEFTGHGIAAIADKPNAEPGKNRAYAAVESCVKAVHYFEHEQEQWLYSPATFDQPLSVTIFLPLVVLDGQLFTASITPDGSDVIRQVPAASVHFRAGRRAGITVPIVTVDALQDFATRAKDVWRRIGTGVTDPDATDEHKSLLHLIVRSITNSRFNDSKGDGDPTPG